MVVELESTLDHVTILHHYVEAHPAMEVVPMKKSAIKIVVVVSYVFMYTLQCFIKWLSKFKPLG